MAESPENPKTSGEPVKASLPVRMRAWASEHPYRSAGIGVGLLVLGGATIVTWLLLASLAAPHHVATLDETLASLDAGDNDVARHRAERLQSEPDRLAADEHGGPLYVLGKLKALEAETQWSDERRRDTYLIASQYLAQARRLGLPEEREVNSLYLLGKAMIESGQLEGGIEALDEALGADPGHATEIHRLLAEAHFYQPQPKYDEVLSHLSEALAGGGLIDDQIASAHLRRAQAYSKLRQFDEALTELAAASAAAANPAEAALVEGQVLVEALEAATVRPDGTRRLARDAEVERAEQLLVQAEGLDKFTTRISAAARYLRGRLHELQGKNSQALREYLEVRRNYGQTAEGIAASLAEADVMLREGRNDDSLAAYRQAALGAADRAAYRSDLIPLGAVQARILAARSTLLAKNQFENALALIQHLGNLFDPAKRIELRAMVLQTWGDHLLDLADQQRWPPANLRRDARLRLRQAGSYYERLAKARYATDDYAEDLWKSAEAYYRGHSFSSAERVLIEYLNNEPRKRNAMALLRLGQAHLARGHTENAVSVLDECVEFYPNDAATYQARLDGARAHRANKEFDQAEEMLKTNLIGSTLSPKSPEWRDSKFELGRLLHSLGKYEDAILELEESIARYPADPQARLAQYLVAESYRHAAEEPLARYRVAKAVNAREESRREYEEKLGEAIKYYKQVQQEITLAGDTNPMDRAMLRNCYMLRGAALFDLGKYEEAVRAYSNVSTLYQNHPFVLETLVQIAHCWRRLNDAPKARGAIEQATQVLDLLPPTTDFLAVTSHSRNEWESLLREMKSW